MATTSVSTHTHTSDPAPVLTMPTPTQPAPEARTHREIRDVLDVIRVGKATIDGSTVRRPDFQVERSLWVEVRKHLLSRGAFFRAPYPYYHDRTDHMVTRVDGTTPTPEMAYILRVMGLLAGQKHTKLIAANIEATGMIAPLRDLHRLSCFSGDRVYLNAGDNKMIRISTDAIEEVSLGTDDVILLCDDVGRWPELSELRPHLDAIRPVLGRTCTRPIPELPLTRYIQPRWSTQSRLSPDQAQWMHLTRFLFCAVADLYPTWPITSFVGMEGSGKSTPGELQLALIAGRAKDAQAMPHTDGDLIAAVTHSPYLVLDNIDRAGLDEKKNAHINDIFCHLATGSEFPLRVLYRTNDKISFKLRNHVVTSSCTNPFPYSDTQRRVLQFDLETVVAKKLIPKQKLIQDVLGHRPEMLSEYILRSQNILRAHLAADPAATPEYITAMTEYEHYTYVCSTYEDSLPEMQSAWGAYVGKYQEAITEANPLVFAVRLWLGQESTRVGKWISPTELFVELQAIYKLINQKLIYTAPNSFSRSIQKNIKPLIMLGLEEKRPNSGRVYQFLPSQEELTRARTLYLDMLKGAGADRADSSLYEEGLRYENTEDLQ